MRKNFKPIIITLALVLVTSVMLSGTLAKYTSEFAGQDTALVARWTFEGDGGLISGNTNTPKTLDLFTHEYDKYINQTGTDSDGETSCIIGPGVDGAFNVEFNYTGDADAAITLALESESNGALPPIQYSLSSDFSNFTYDLNELSEQMLQNLYYANSTSKPAQTPPDAAWTKIGTEDIKAHATATNAVYRGSADINPALVSFVSGTTAPQNTVVVTKTDDAANITYVSVPVYWRWAYNVSDHNTALLNAAGFTGSGTDGAWTDADDTAIGKASQTENRLEYRINVNVTATQVVPEKTE